MGCLTNVTQQSCAHSWYQPSYSESQFVLLQSGYVTLPWLLGMVSVAMRKSGSQRAPQDNPASETRLRCRKNWERSLGFMQVATSFVTGVEERPDIRVFAANPCLLSQVLGTVVQAPPLSCTNIL